MRRRQFIGFVVSAVAALPAGAFAQRSLGRPLVGVLIPQSLAGSSRNISAMRAGLRDAGFVEGQNVWLEIRFADGEIARLSTLAAELVALNPDVIFTGSAPAIVAIYNATKTIPVVMNTFVDPVALGVVKNLAKPGGNVTGIFAAGGADALTGKRLSLLKQVVPNLSRVGVMTAPGDSTDAIMLRLLPASTSALGLTYRVFEIGNSTKLDNVFTEAARDGLQGLFISQNPYFFTRRVEVATLAARVRLPAIYSFREHVEAGGLMSYGSSLTEAYRQAARLTAKILKGAIPAEIPVEQADRFELVVNNKTARTLGLKISESFLVNADEVIE
jgi:putative ABC transport system substrate-binding protein